MRFECISLFPRSNELIVPTKLSDRMVELSRPCDPSSSRQVRHKRKASEDRNWRLRKGYQSHVLSCSSLFCLRTRRCLDSLTNCPGSSLVKIGSTSVVCAIKLEVGRPFDTKPQDGRLGQEEWESWSMKRARTHNHSCVDLAHRFVRATHSFCSFHKHTF